MKTILANDYFNALYEDGVLKQDGKPEYLDAETLARVDPTAEVYVVPQAVYDAVLDGAGYPRELANFPLDQCERVR